MLRIRLLATLALCSLSTGLFSQDISLAGKIDQFYDAWASPDKPGCAVGVIKDGMVVFAKGYGMANLEHRIPFTPETVSDIGSVAKQITDFGIALLVQQGRLKLTDDIRTYLPFLPDFGQVIQVQHLIHHTSGLREIYGTEAIRGNRGGDAIFQEDVLWLVERQQELNFPPGDRYLYCNTAYALLAEIIEKVGGTHFETWMRGHIFARLGMTNTFIMDHQGELFPNTADSYYNNGEGGYVKAYDNSTIRGQGGVYASLTDMLKWTQNLLTPALGGPEVIRQMTTRGVLNNGDTLNYAFGLEVERYRGVQSWSHSGSSAGFRSLLYVFPDHGLGIMVKNNNPEIPLPGLVELVAEHYLGDQLAPRPRPEPRPRTVREPYPLTEEALQAFAGRYLSPELETWYELSVQDGKLMARHFRQAPFEMEPIGKDQFRAENGSFSEIVFERNAAGEVTGLRVSNGRVLNLLLVKS
ncbi:MAG: beta-lactamase family protein [Saprospiraceae bacterium]|nr:beta-lactamase family protein [Saprospiraceae bacterium]